MKKETLRRYRLIISLLVILLPIAFLIGVLSGQYDVINNHLDVIYEADELVNDNTQINDGIVTKAVVTR